MKPQFTPGPWRTTGLNVRAGDALICFATDHWYAEDNGFYAFTDLAEKQANATLISCAPELLDALERLAHPMADDEDLDYAREIIAKAKGQL
jgi:hypothetical protein